MGKKFRLALGVGGMAVITGLGACTTATAEQPVAPAAGAGYVMPDGTIRVVGAASMQRVIEKLNAMFAEKHPGLHFRYAPADNNGAIDALIFDATPFAPDGTVYSGGIAYSDIVKAPPFAVRIAHGSLDPQAKISPLAVIVNASNPVQKLSVAQLASIFSKPARAPVFAKWSQLGVQGVGGNGVIEPGGLPWSDHYASEDRSFGDDVFYRSFGGAAPVDDYRMFETYAEVVDFVARERDAIGIVPINKISGGVKRVALVEGPLGIARTGTTDDIRSGHYPLDRYLYLYLRVQTNKPLDPLVREYVRMVLSPEGQAAITAEGEGYIPLDPMELAEEQSKFE
ncbi:MAG TPA: substrate-binding domain-containing protein [Acidobacteriaceae bacterium]|nr:substrate-binding domain-containing protein [Acidobacteriaceae bacterium]